MYISTRNLDLTVGAWPLLIAKIKWDWPSEQFYKLKTGICIPHIYRLLTDYVEYCLLCFQEASRVSISDSSFVSDTSHHDAQVKASIREQDSGREEETSTSKRHGNRFNIFWYCCFYNKYNYRKRKKDSKGHQYRSRDRYHVSPPRLVLIKYLSVLYSFFRKSRSDSPSKAKRHKDH